jgi:excisionase family DNA binding protein
VETREQKMRNSNTDVRSDLGSVKAKIDSALVGVRIAEKMALDATAVLERVEQTLRFQRPDHSPPEQEPLAVSRAEAVRAVSTVTAGRMLGLGKTSVHKLLKEGTLESRKVGRSRRILVSSIEKLLGANDVVE